MSKFKIGDEVKWSSQAQGSTSKKEGKIVAIIKANQNPGEVIYPLENTGKYSSAYGGGMSRNHESYVVAVPHKGKGKAKLYWPLVSKLTLNQKSNLLSFLIGGLTFICIGAGVATSTDILTVKPAMPKSFIVKTFESECGSKYVGDYVREHMKNAYILKSISGANIGEIRSTWVVVMEKY